MSESESDDLEFRINTKFAENYDKWRRKEELQKLKDRYGDEAEEDSSSSSEEEDEDAEELTAQIEKDFLKTLSYVRSRDPKIYNRETTFYHSQDASSDGNSEDEDVPAQASQAKRKAKKEDKPVFLKDYERQIITEKGGRYSDESEDEEEEGEDLYRRAASPTYIQEQEQIKKSFQKVLLSSDSEVSDEEAPLLKRRKKTPREEKEEQEEYLQWMKGQKESLSDEGAVEDAAEMEALRKYWTDPSLEEGEKFLRDFILNKGYKEKDIPGEDAELEEANFSEEERLLDNQDDFERKYNFRYEEPDEEFIKRYPRTMLSSVRTKDNKRSVKRQERKERKIEEKERKKDELKRLKNLKKQEILDRLKKLQQVTGNTSTGFDDEDLEGDFDPDKHDKAMQKVFNDHYNALDEEDTKPEFEHEDWEEENWDNWDGQDYNEDYYNEEGGYCEDADFNMDADYDPSLSKQANKDRKAATQQELIQSSYRKKKKKKQSKFAEALSAKKPVFDPADKTFAEYIDEFYKLDYEDMIGDMPCRFKYRQVVANDFGLSTEEILSAKERELNQWASLKKTCQYRTEDEEDKDKKLFSKKGHNQAKKKRIFLSLQEISDESEGSGDEGTKKRPAGNAKNQSLPLSKKPGKKKGTPAKGSETPGRAEAPSPRDLKKVESKSTLPSERKAKSDGSKVPSKNVQPPPVEVNRKQPATKPTKQTPGSATKQAGKDKDRGFRKLIQSEMETGKETSTDHAVRNVREESRIVKNAQEKKKKKTQQIPNGDNLKGKIFHSQSDEKSDVQKPKSKETVALNSDSASTIKSTTNSKKRKRRRKASENSSKVETSNLKTDTGISSTLSVDSRSVTPSIARDGNSDLKTVSQTQGSKKRKRKRKDSSHGKESGLVTQSPSTKKPAPTLKQKQPTKQPSPPTSKNPQTKPTPKSVKPDKINQEQKAPDKEARSQRTRNKNRNRKRAKLAQKKAAVESKVKPTVSDARLKAYGINPKKHGYRMQFLKEQEAKKKLAKNQEGT